MSDSNPPFIIGLAGPAGCGKDTATAFILKNFKRFESQSFAAPIKEMCRTGLGLTLAQTDGNMKEVVDHRYGCTPRHIMQTLGTEWGRNIIHPDIWVTAAKKYMWPYTVISDVRFENEAAFVRKHGVLVHIEGRGGLEGEAASHASEAGVKKLVEDYSLINCFSLKDLEHAVIAMVDVITEENIGAR